MISLIIPWVLLLLLLITVILLLKRRWALSIITALILVVLNHWSSCFSFGFRNNESGDIKVLSFNVNGVGEYDRDKVQAIISIIEEEAPDIVFLTEDYMSIFDPLSVLLHPLYPYDTWDKEDNIFYSKHPLNNPRFFKRPGGGQTSLDKCSAVVKGKEMFFLGCHLPSNNYSEAQDYLPPSEVKSLSDIKLYLSNIASASQQRATQVDTILNYCDKKAPVIIMGDMNDVCGAPSMQKFKRAGFKDAWSVGGFGYGATIHHPLPYRIDHILYNDALKLKGIKRIKARSISDHDALVAVFDFE